MTQSIRLLVLEDNPDDVELMLRELRHAGYTLDCAVVDNEEAYRRELDSEPDLILADYTLPKYDALRALHELQARRLDIPFIVVTTAASEEAAISCMREGAEDYLLKDRLTRLGQAVRHALHERDLRAEKRHAETALRESEARFRILAETTAAGIGILQSGRFAYVNPQFETLTGYPRYQLLTMRVFDLVHPDFHHIGWLVGTWPEGADDVPYRVELRILNAHGAELWWEVTAGALNFDGLPAVLITAFDITARKLFEQALRESEEKFRAIFSESLDVIVILDGDAGSILHINPAARRILGYDEQALIGRPFGILFAPEGDLQPDRYVEQIRVKDGIFEGQPFTRADGSCCPMDVTATVIPWGRNEVILVTLRDASERVAATELLEQRVQARTAELAAANEKLQVLDRMKSKFVSDVSHELRSPVTTLGMYIYLLENDRPERRAEHLAVLNRQIARLRTLVENILDLSRLENSAAHISRTAVELNDVVENVVTSHAASASNKGLQLLYKLATNLPPVYGNSSQLAQVIENLVANAVNYTRGGYVKVTTLYDAAREQICLQVEDSGIGIPEDDLPHIFERFYRGSGREVVSGSGLGLSIVKEIIDQHGGEIVLESRAREGTTFRVYLPLAEAGS